MPDASAPVAVSTNRRTLLKTLAGAGVALPVAARLAAAASPSRPIRVLSIDGGGMRGIIPGRVLQELERRSGKPTAELFDLVVGTSTGALLSLGVTVPGGNGRPAYSAEELVGLYEAAGPTIFPHRRGLRSYFAGFVRPTYDPAGFEDLLEQYFGATALSEALIEVAVPTISLEATSLEVFTRRAARGAPGRNYLMRDLVRAATAAPVYFPAARISSIDGSAHGTYIDAGVSTNNPAIMGFAEAKVMEASAPVVMVSLGTGKKLATIDPAAAAGWGEVEWLTAVFDIQGDAQSTYTHGILSELLVDHDEDLFFRFQVGLRKVPPAMDDTTPAHMAALKELAETEIRIVTEDIDKLIARLVRA